MRSEDFEHDDGYWIFDDQKLYLIDGSMMTQCWLIVTELMRRRKDLNDDFLFVMLGLIWGDCDSKN